MFRLFFNFLIFFLIALIVSGCASRHDSLSWERTKAAAYSAATDKMTWIPVVSGVAINVSGYDDDMARHIMDEDDPFIDEDVSDRLRDVTTLTTYATAFMVPDNNMTIKTRRLVVESAALGAARGIVTIANNQIPKTAPNGWYDEAVGSNHAVTPFAASALTRRNVEQLDIPTWGKYSINTMTYLAATGSMYQRIEQGLHSPVDQLYSIAVGNFLALFIHDAFMASDTQLGIELHPKETKITLNIPF